MDFWKIIFITVMIFCLISNIESQNKIKSLRTNNKREKRLLSLFFPNRCPSGSYYSNKYEKCKELPNTFTNKLQTKIPDKNIQTTTISPSSKMITTPSAVVTSTTMKSTNTTK